MTDAPGVARVCATIRADAHLDGGPVLAHIWPPKHVFIRFNTAEVNAWKLTGRFCDVASFVAGVHLQQELQVKCNSREQRPGGGKVCVHSRTDQGGDPVLEPLESGHASKKRTPKVSRQSSHATTGTPGRGTAACDVHLSCSAAVASMKGLPASELSVRYNPLKQPAAVSSVRVSGEQTMTSVRIPSELMCSRTASACAQPLHNAARVSGALGTGRHTAAIQPSCAEASACPHNMRHTT